jgi:hypothetical protein
VYQIASDSYPSSRYHAGWKETAQYETEAEEDEISFSCLGSLRSYITAFWKYATTNNPDAQIAASSEGVAGNYAPPQPTSTASILRPDCTSLLFISIVPATLVDAGS